MHPADITAALHKAGSNQSAIAKELKISHMAISNVVHDRMKSTRVAVAISRTTGIPVEKLWPGRYSSNKRAA